MEMLRGNRSKDNSCICLGSRIVTYQFQKVLMRESASCNKKRPGRLQVSFRLAIRLVSQTHCRIVILGGEWLLRGLLAGFVVLKVLLA